MFQDCVYVEGNIEISNLNPFASSGTFELDGLNQTQLDQFDQEYDFSFLNKIKEISGYLLIHNTILRTIRFESLQVIRGRHKIADTSYSLYIGGNSRLEKLDFTSLREIEHGFVYIKSNRRLCHMNEVNWLDIVNDPKHSTHSKIERNANLNDCPKCASNCSSNHCWFVGGCQQLTKVNCVNCGNDRCFSDKQNQCCNSMCLGGCVGKGNDKCHLCKHVKNPITNECLETCPPLFKTDPRTGIKIKNEDGLYQYEHSCVKECPPHTFIFDEVCLRKCPNTTQENEEIITLPDNTTTIRRSCVKCVGNCPRVCSIDNKELKKSNLKELEGW